mmetsp:Transcript_4355/g.15439  ORF Transcript_4355/g.15439 Transcript_4355/m.15439 type:complete len:113 (-) Transcript_4355:661-999(-)
MAADGFLFHALLPQPTMEDLVHLQGSVALRKEQKQEMRGTRICGGNPGVRSLCLEASRHIFVVVGGALPTDVRNGFPGRHRWSWSTQAIDVYCCVPAVELTQPIFFPLFSFS